MNLNNNTATLQRQLHVSLGHIASLFRTRDKFRAIKLVFLIGLVLIVPTLFFVDSSVNLEESLETVKTTLTGVSHNSSSSSSLKHAQESHIPSTYGMLNPMPLESLAQIVLPPYELIFDESLYWKDDYDYLFDTRLSTWLWLSKLKQHLEENNGVMDRNFKLPFIWNDFVDVKTKLNMRENIIQKYISEHSNDGDFLLKGVPEEKYLERLSTNLTCDDMRKIFGYQNQSPEEDTFYQCKDLTADEKEKQFPLLRHNFRILDYSKHDQMYEARIITSAVYLYTNNPAPDRVVFLGAGFDSEPVVIVPEYIDIATVTTLNKNGYNYQFLRDYLERESEKQGVSTLDIYKRGITINEIVRDLKQAYNTEDLSLQPYYTESELLFDTSYLLHVDHDLQTMTKMEMTVGDFLWDSSSILNGLSEKYTDLNDNYFGSEKDTDPLLSIEQSYDYKLFNKMKYTIDTTEGNKYPKYLRESTIGPFKGSSHLDWRFFDGLFNNGDTRPEWERRAILHRMGRAYLRFCYSFGIKTWVSYGAMLGWYRNGLSLSWDTDIDAVMTVASMHKIAKFNNNSLIIDVTQEDGYFSGIGSYYFDIAAPYIARERGIATNGIDGRFADTGTGVYIDLSCVAHTEWWGSEDTEIDDTMRKMIDVDYNSKKDHAEEKTEFNSREEYDKFLDSQLKEKYDQKETYHCKNNNFYLLEELNPMIPTMFEGVRAYVPHSYIKLMNRKYPDALGRDLEDGPGYEYKKHLRLWAPLDSCRRNNDDRDGELCFDPTLRAEYRRTQDYTAQHAEEMRLSEEERFSRGLALAGESHPMYYDKFFAKYAELLRVSI